MAWGIFLLYYIRSTQPTTARKLVKHVSWQAGEKIRLEVNSEILYIPYVCLSLLGERAESNMLFAYASQVLHVCVRE